MKAGMRGLAGSMALLACLALLFAGPAALLRLSRLLLLALSTLGFSTLFASSTALFPFLTRRFAALAAGFISILSHETLPFIVEPD